MLTLNELAIHRARLLRQQDGINPREEETTISALDDQIIAQAAVTPEDAVAKLELARELARADGCPRVVRLIEGALEVLRH